MGLIDYSLLVAGEQINLPTEISVNLDNSLLISGKKEKKAASEMLLQSREGQLSDMFTPGFLAETEKQF
mgnify:CR=1 FL=1|jgi:hypothetical protein